MATLDTIKFKQELAIYARNSSNLDTSGLVYYMIDFRKPLEADRMIFSALVWGISWKTALVIQCEILDPVKMTLFLTKVGKTNITISNLKSVYVI